MGLKLIPLKTQNVQRNKKKENRTGQTMTTKRKRQRTRIGQWNIRTLYQKGKLPQLNKEFSRLKLEVLGLSEVRWTGFGKFYHQKMAVSCCTPDMRQSTAVVLESC